MREVNAIAMAILTIVLVIAVLQRATQTNTILSGIAGLTTSVVGSLTGAPTTAG